MFVIIFSCFRFLFLDYLKSETGADGRHFGFLKVATMTT